jgi:hypothetical protein
MSKKTIETFAFTDLAGLRDFLNGFKTRDLDTVLPDSADHIKLDWIEETLSDGGIVNNVRIKTV